MLAGGGLVFPLGGDTVDGLNPFRTTQETLE